MTLTVTTCVPMAPPLASMVTKASMCSSHGTPEQLSRRFSRGIAVFSLSPNIYAVENVSARSWPQR
jgi:hypothetical protein